MNTVFGVDPEAAILFVTLIVLIAQTAATRREMRRGAVRNIYDRYMEIAKLEVEYPELHKMFMDAHTSKQLANLSQEDLRLRALSMFVFDQFALIYNLGERQRKLVVLDPIIERLFGATRLGWRWRAYVDRNRTVLEINREYIRATFSNPKIIYCWRDLGLGDSWRGSLFYEHIEAILAEQEQTTEAAGEDKPSDPTNS